MNEIVDENNKGIVSIKGQIEKAVKIFAEQILIQEVDKLLEEKHVCGIKVILDLQAGNVAKYKIESEKQVIDNGSAFAIVDNSWLEDRK